MSELLSVPFKNTIELDLVEPFKRLFLVCEITKNYDKELSQLNSLRSEILPKNISKSSAGLDALVRYHDQIEILERKIPSEGLNSLNIHFLWEDALDKGSLLRGKASTNLSFLSFERQCILFNMAALQTQLASEFRSSDSDDDHKIVAKWFQQASGLFAHLASSITLFTNQNLTLDLCPDTLDSLSILMLAQAQEIFVTKAIKDHMKDPIIAKLCVQAEDMFSEALLKMTKENIKHQWERNWLGNVAGKRMAYEALAQYYQSKACATTKRIGEQISRLNLSIELLLKAQDKLQNPNFYSFYTIEANRLVAEAIKDNDFIYHEQIPPYNKLPGIEKVSSARLAKPTPVLTQKFSSSFKDLFEELQPLSITVEKLSSLKSKADEAFAQEVKLPSKSSVQEIKAPSSPSTVVPTPSNSQKNESEELNPLKLALDASLNAVNYYMQQYLQGRKSE